jgi:hypothetical protein
MYAMDGWMEVVRWAIGDGGSRHPKTVEICSL